MVNYSTYSDEQLVALLQKDNEPAFDAIYHRYWKRLFSLAANKLKDLYLAEEIVQDVFISLWNRRKKLEINGHFASYLSKAVKYKIIDASLKQDKINSREQQFDPTKDQSYASDTSFKAYELKDQLTQGISSLPDKSQLVFELSKRDGYTHKEIAYQLKISEKTVEYHLSKAVKQLRASFGELLFLLIIIF